MLQKSLLFGFAFLFSFSLQAQRKRNLSIGPLIGVNVSTLRGDLTNTGTTYKAGLVAGGFFNYSIKETFGINGQLLYSQLGRTYKPAAATLKERLNYLQIPLHAVFFFGKGMSPGTVRPKLFLGPYVGFLLAQRNDDGNELQLPGNAGVPYKSFDAGLNLGGGLNFALKNQSWINLDVKYGLGLVDISRVDNVLIRNGAFSATLGVSFPLGNYDDRNRTIRR